MSDLPTTSIAEPQTTSIVTRASEKQLRLIDLVGDVSHQITGAKLPSNRQMLQIFFYNKRIERMDKKDSARLSVDAALIFWQQARIPTRQPNKCVEKLLKLYEEHRNIQKSAKGAKPHSKADEFISKLDDLFDIASANAMEIIKIEEDKQFLTMQREKGRRGCMAGVDMNLFAGKNVHKIEKRKKDQENGNTRKCHNNLLVNNLSSLHD